MRQRLSVEVGERVKSLAEVLCDWEAVIGLEIHTELTALKTKMFCNCRLSHHDEPNTNVCPVCLGMPGALPVPNREAIKSIVMAGLATNCKIQKRTCFYRKHYFYPDMAKNYQTTQGPVAFCMNGRLVLEVTGEGATERPDSTIGKDDDGSYTVSIRIKRIHMEEDAAKMVHVGGKEGRIGGASESLIDYNRCGIPLIELVTDPDLRTPEEARLFMEKLRQTFLALGISDCSLEHGSMRCDGNVSIRRRGDVELGTKVEMKNINSFKSLHDALAYEICRQAQVLEEGGAVLQETRHWEPSGRRTTVMRTKEAADDYRMYPDPDLPPFNLPDEFIEQCRARMPELPDAKRNRYMKSYGLRRREATYIAADPKTARLFEEAVALAGDAPLMVANVTMNLVPAVRNVQPFQVASISQLICSDAITFAQAREVLQIVDGTTDDPRQVVDERGMRQCTDAITMANAVDAVLAHSKKQINQYQDGNKKVIGYLIGQCMKASQGAGNPKYFGKILKERLER